MSIRTRSPLARIAAVAREIAAELRRLNSARLNSAALGQLSRRDRARIVKAALAAHHRHPNRCC